MVSIMLSMKAWKAGVHSSSRVTGRACWRRMG